MNTVISSRFSVFSLLLVDILFDVPKCEFVLNNSLIVGYVSTYFYAVCKNNFRLSFWSSFKL